MIPDTEVFQRYSAEGARAALSTINDRYGRGGNPENNYQFHSLAHSKLVAKRVSIILERMEQAVPGYVSKREQLLASPVTLSHDIFIGWEAEEKEDSGLVVVKMKRFIGQNELQSAKELKDWMEGLNYTYEGVFDKTDEEIAFDVIRATIPDFNPDLGTVIQPNLNENSSPLTRALALGDLGSAGMNPERFAEEGDALFREENLDVFRAMTRGKEPLSKQQREFFRDRILTWTRSQIRFAQGRKIMLGEELKGLPREAKGAVSSLFTRYDDSIRLIELVTTQREQMGFVELLADVGYFTDSRSHLIKLELVA